MSGHSLRGLGVAATLRLAIGQRSHNKGANPMRNIDLQAKLSALLSELDRLATVANENRMQAKRFGDTAGATWSDCRAMTWRHASKLVRETFLDFMDDAERLVPTTPAQVNAIAHVLGADLTDEQAAYLHRHRECGPDCCITGDRCSDDPQTPSSFAFMHDAPATRSEV